MIPSYCLVHVVHENLISILVTDHIQKRRGQAFLFSFEYNLLANLISNFNHYMDRARRFLINFLIHNLFQIFWWWVLCKIFQLAAPPTYLPRSITSLQCTYPKSILQYFLQSNCMTFELNDTFVKCIFKYLVFQQVQYVVHIYSCCYIWVYLFHSYFLDFQLTEQAIDSGDERL